MDRDDAIEALRRWSSRSQDKELQAKIAGLQWEIKKMLIMEETSKNESKNCGEEWTKCYKYFMVQVQVQTEEDWGPHWAEFLSQKSCLKSSPKRRRKSHAGDLGRAHTFCKRWELFLITSGRIFCIIFLCFPSLILFIIPQK